jgi:DNA-directed RNA polymerase specialized sigma24 family protein
VNREEHDTQARGTLSAAEARLVEQIRNGDAEAGRQFVHDYHPAIYRYLLYLTGQRETAEDLTQETFLQAWRHLHTFAGRAPLKAWLHRIAHREFLRTLERKHPQADLEALRSNWRGWSCARSSANCRSKSGSS